MKSAVKSSYLWFGANLVGKSKKMDPSWPYPSSNAYYMPLRAMTQDTRNSFGHHKVNFSQPTFVPYQFSHGSSGSSSPAPLGEETFESQSPSQSNQQSKKYDKWTNEQQKYLVQLWAEKQDVLNSKDARNAWRAIAEVINNKFATWTRWWISVCEKLST